MSKTSSKVQKSPSSVFVGMALDMSWRLALVVLVPIVGGYQLDQAMATTPLLTIVGFLAAMTGMALVMWSTLQKANQTTGAPVNTASQEKPRAK